MSKRALGGRVDLYTYDDSPRRSKDAMVIRQSRVDSRWEDDFKKIVQHSLEYIWLTFGFEIELVKKLCLI